VRLDPKAERPRSNLVHAAVVLGRPVPPEAVAPAAPGATAPVVVPPAEPGAETGAVKVPGAELGAVKVPAATTAAKDVPADAPKKEAHP